MARHPLMHGAHSINPRPHCPYKRPRQSLSHERRIAKEEEKLPLDRLQCRQPGGQACTHSLPVTGSMNQPHAWHTHRSDESGDIGAVCAGYHDHPPFCRHSRRQEGMREQGPAFHGCEKLVPMPEAPRASRREKDRRAHQAQQQVSDLNLASELDHAVGGQLEEFHRAFRVAKHPGEQLLAPDRHAGARRRQ